MTQQPPLRDYIYVSARKVERLAAAVPGRRGRRLRELNLNAGVVGAGFALSEAPAETLIGAIPGIERELYDKREVRWLDDSTLGPGDWFTVTAMPMAYGVHLFRARRDDPLAGRDTGAAIFVGEDTNTRLLLSGSAEHLLDRKVPSEDFGASMSDPQAIHRLLRGLSDTEGPVQPQGMADHYGASDDYAISHAMSILGNYGWQSLTFLARAIRVTPAHEGSGRGANARNVIGTPLWVAFAPPR